MLAQAISRTMPTAPSSISIHDRMCAPTMWSTSGRTPIARFLFHCGLARSMASASTSICALAWSSDTPGDSRAITCRYRENDCGLRMR